MAKSITPIITSIGIGAAAPFTAGHYALISSATPPFVTNGRLAQLADAGQSVVAPAVSGALHTLQLGEGVSSGLGTQQVLIGDNIKTNGLLGSIKNIGIGGNIDFSAAAGGIDSNIWIGFDFTIGTPSGTANNVIVGHAPTTTAAVSGAVGLGNNVRLTGGDAVAVGANTEANGESSTFGKGSKATGSQGNAFGKLARAQGARAIAIGNNCKADQDNEISIGFGINAATFANPIRIGRNAEVFEANCVSIGTDPTDGTEVRVLRLGPNTLTGYPGLSVFLPSAAAGNNVAAPNVTIRAGISTGNNVTKGRVQFQTGIPTGTAANYQALETRLELAPAAAGDSGMAFPNALTGAGAGVGTLTNAPHAGDPDFWLIALVAGVRVAFPAWNM